MQNLPELIRSNRSLFTDFFRDIDEFFNMRTPLFSRSREGWIQAAMQIRESKNSYLLSFELPGVKKEDIKVDVLDDVLNVTGERSDTLAEGQEGKAQHYVCYCRSVALPAGIKAEQVQANYENGVLNIVVPKGELSQRRSIEVQSGRSAQAFDTNEQQISTTEQQPLSPTH